MNEARAVNGLIEKRDKCLRCLLVALAAWVTVTAIARSIPAKVRFSAVREDVIVIERYDILERIILKPAAGIAEPVIEFPRQMPAFSEIDMTAFKHGLRTTGKVAPKWEGFLSRRNGRRSHTNEKHVWLFAEFVKQGGISGFGIPNGEFRTGRVAGSGAFAAK